jgi:hypothetical protein
MADPRAQDAALSAPAPTRAPVALATMALVLAAAALAGILYGMILNNQLDARIKALEATQAGDDRALSRLGRSVEALSSAVTLLSDEQADLTNSKLQHLRHGFAVSELKLTRHDTGVLVEGRMINTSSLRYRDATFRIKVGNSNKEFNIGSLAPGASDEFDAELPNLPMENARMATFSLVSSAVEYAR